MTNRVLKRGGKDKLECEEEERTSWKVAERGKAPEKSRGDEERTGWNTDELSETQWARNSFEKNPPTTVWTQVHLFPLERPLHIYTMESPQFTL
jgi:hypothetical protein